MTALPKSKRSQPQRQAPDPTLVWVLSPTLEGESVAAVRVEALRVGSAAPQIIDSFAFNGHACIREVLTRCEATPPSRIVVVLPGSAVICRTLTLPSGSADQLEMALRLQIENLLLGGSARWRTEGAMLPATDPDAPRKALVVEWPAKQTAPADLLPIMQAVPVTFAPSIAALATLVTGAIGLGASESLAMDLERAAGSIAIAFSNGLKSAFRVVREDGTNESQWRDAIVRALRETLLAAEVPDTETEAICVRVESAIERRCEGFFAPLSGGIDSFRSLIKGSPDDDAWWHQNGTAAGAAAALGQPTARLCGLRAHEEVENPGIARRMLAAAMKPKVAARLAIAATVAIALVPPAVAGARLLYLRWLLPEPQAYGRILDRDDKQGSMYRDYERYAWPITKLLGDVASTTPVGIELETITLGQAAPLSVTGTSKPVGSGSNAADSILQMEAQMRASGVFDRVEKSWDAPNNNGVVKFELAAAIVKPTLVPNYTDDQDFAKRTLRERKYGSLPSEGTSTAPDSPSVPTLANDSAPDAGAPHQSSGEGTAATAAASPPVAAAGANSGASDEARTRRRPSSGGASGGTDIARRGSPGAQAVAPAVPEPLTDQHIAAMTQAEAREAAGRVSTARGLSGLDEATEARLKAEFYKLLERARNP